MGLTLGAANPEYHRIDGSALIVHCRSGSAARFGAPPEIVFPAGAGVAQRAVDVDLHHIVARAVDEVHRELDRVSPASVEPAGDQRLDEVVLDPAPHAGAHRSAIRTEGSLILIIVEE